jgi:hypothetical protein
LPAIIDRFEGSWAVIEFDGTVFDFPRELLPAKAREGDVLRFSVTVDSAGTVKRRKRVQRLEGELFK